jgi:hypothetical protein
VWIAQGEFLVEPDIALVINDGRKKAISYVANNEDRASKNASYAQSFKIASEYNGIRIT